MVRLLLTPHHMPCSAPSPLAGEGWGGGWLRTQSFLGHPPPCPSPARGEGTPWLEPSDKDQL
jgi:hypothetical protein